MKIGIAGPLNLSIINIHPGNYQLPTDYSFPMYSLYINSLLRRGHQVVAFTLSSQIDDPGVVEDGNITLCIAPSKPQKGRRLFHYERKGLTQLMKEHAPDIIHALWSYEFAWASHASGIPTVITLQDHASTILKYQFDGFRMARWLMNFIILRKRNFLIANSPYLFSLLTKKQQSKAKIIYNFYSHSLEKYYERSTEKSNYILSVANGFGKRKNIGNALLAFSQVRKECPTIEYHLIGMNMEEGGLAHQFAIRHGVTEGVRFMGRKPFSTVIEEMVHARAVLHTSREESFGMSVLEPLVIGTPVVGGSKSGNIPFLLDQGNTGELCDVENPKSIAEGIVHIVKDKQYAERLREKASRYARENFNEDTVVDQHLEYYREILNVS